MAIDQLTAKIYNKLSKANLAGAEGKVAVQFNLTGKVTGVFYIEILNGVPSVMPYEYIDHDAIVSGSLTNIENCQRQADPAGCSRRGQDQDRGQLRQGYASGRADEVKQIKQDNEKGSPQRPASLLYQKIRKEGKV